MTLTVLLALLLVGLAVGFASGLIGIGGGVLIVPFLYFFYNHPAWSGTRLAPTLHAEVAHATSLFIILPTALLGVRQYAKGNLVEWRAAVPIALFSILGSLTGVYLETRLPEPLLRVFFGALLIVVGFQLLRSSERISTLPLNLGVGRMAATGILVGLLSAMLGVGGGVVAVPMLIYLVHLEIRKTAATSLAIVAAAGATGTVSYLIAGLNTPGLPPGSIGYIHVLAALPILVGSALSVRLGTHVNQRMNSRALRMMFAWVFIVLGSRLLWQNIPEFLNL